MRTQHSSTCARIKARVAVLTIISLLAPSAGPIVAAQAPAAKPPATQTPTAKPTTAKPSTAPGAATTAPAPPDGGWPRNYTTPSGAALVIYQPQLASWADQKHATLYAAVSYTAKGAKAPALGTIKMESETSVAVDERLVSFSDFKIADPNFPTLERDAVKGVVSEITTSVPLDERVIALDRVLANMDTSQIIPKNVEGLKADPPTIFFSQTPAVLVNIDGDPIWSPIPQNDLRSAVNTNWDLFEHGPSKTYYLRNDRMWLKSSDVKGPWTPAGKLPPSFEKLPADENWKDVKATLPGQKVSAKDMPKVFVSLEPAELILLRGKPNYLKVEGAKQLLWVSNTDSDVFRMSLPGAVYFLVAGRWFSAPDFTGPWTFATPTLPDDFKQIPLEHERSRVLASVPGTPQAIEAVLLARIPQTARVSRTVMAPEVSIRGRAPVPADREDVRAARGQHRQGHPEGRRPLLHVFPGRLVHVEDADRAVGGDGRSPEVHLRDSGELAVPCRHLRHGGGIEQRCRGVCDGGRVHGCDDWRGAVPCGARATTTRRTSGTAGCIRTTGLTIQPTGLAPGTTRGPARTPAARWRTVRTAVPVSAQRYNPRTGTYSRGAAACGPYGARGAPGIQSAHGRIRRDSAGIECVWQLGHHRSRARRSVGHHVALHQQRHG